MATVTKPGPELRERLEAHHPNMLACIDVLYADFGAKLLSVKSEAADIDVVAKRVAEAAPRVAVRIWPEMTAAEARESAANRARD